MAGKKNERQELKFIEIIKNSYLSSNSMPLVVNVACVLLQNIIDANKCSDSHILGYEPYADIVLEDYHRILKISMKGSKSPSLAGGGINGIDLISPGLSGRFMNVVHSVLSTKLNIGDKVPEVYGKIPEDDKIKLMLGNHLIGGPIDYLFVGPMDFKYEWVSELNELRIEGNLYKAVDFARDSMLYFRLRSRRKDQTFDPISRDSFGRPKIYGKSPSRGDSSGRLVITNIVPANAEVVII